MTSTASKNAEISRRILAHVSAGCSPAQALDLVCGEGTFAKMAGEIYDALRAKT